MIYEYPINSGTVTIHHDTTSVEVIPHCYYCSGYHTGICPRVIEIEYYNDGAIKKVTLKESVYDN